MNNKTKLKVATAVLVGGLAITGGIKHNRQFNSYEAQYKKEVANMSAAEAERSIKECDIALQRLQQTIDAAETNAEERFDAIRSHKTITQHRELLQKRLDEIQKKQSKTTDIRNAMKTR